MDASRWRRLVCYALLAWQCVPQTWRQFSSVLFAQHNFSDTEVMEEGMADVVTGRSVVVSVVDDHPDLCHGVLARLSQASPSFIAGVKAATVAEFLALDAVAVCRSDVV